jgi:hypothetical protein
MIVSGKVQHGGVRNANGRTYPVPILERELAKLAPLIKDRSVLGELDHPEDGKTKLYRVSHLWTDLKIEKDGVVTGTSEVLNTPRGLILQELYRSKVKVGASSRGQGSVNAKTGEVADDFALDTIDNVYRPSTPGAYMEMMKEEVEALDRLVESEEEGSNRLSDVRRLVVEHASSYRDLDRVSQIELGARLMNGEYVCRRLIGRQPLRQLAEETLSLAGELRTRIEHGLGIHCTEGACRLEPAVIMSAVPDIEATNRARASEESSTSQEETKMDDLKALKEEVATLTESIGKYREIETKFSAALKLIEEMKARLESLSAERTEAEERAKAAESLLQESATRLQTMESQQTAGLRRRLGHAENLIGTLVGRFEEGEEGEMDEKDRVLEAAERLGDALIARLNEQSKLAEGASKRAKAAETLLQSTLGNIKNTRMSEALDDLLAKDPAAEKVRPLLEAMEFKTVDEMRAHYARLRSLRRGRAEDSTLPLGNNGNGSLTEEATPRQPQRDPNPKIQFALDVAARLGQ